MRREQLYLEDIISAADAITEFINDQDFESFHTNRVLQGAVVHQFTIIGEASAHLSVELRERIAGILRVEFPE